jgi:hypothetical protein
VSLAKGGMEVQTPAGTLFDDPPVAWQGEAGDRKDVAVAFRAEPRLSGLDDSDSFGFGFEVEPYDRSRELVIDPVFFVYAGFIGGCCTDQGRDIAVDSHGNAYITGITQSPETTFPDGDGFGAVPGFDQSNLTVAAFVAKINPAGSTLLYASYLQGSEFIEGLGIAVDGAGSAYVTGRTGSNAGFVYDDDGVGSVAGPDTTYNGGNTDAFVAKIDPSGTSLLYAGFIGGSGDDAGEAIAVDAAGNAYVTGFTGSHETTFPDGDGFGAVPGMDQSFNGGGDDAFLIRIDAAGSGFDYATYIGGAGGDAGRSVAVDSIGDAYVAGVAGAASTEASFPDGDGFGLVSGFDVTHNGNSEAFVVKVDPTGLGLVYGGFIGGSGIDSADGVVIDAMGSAYVVGSTSSDETTFPDGDGFGALAGPDTSFNGGPVDAFVVKIDPTGDHLVYAGYVGGASTDLAQGIAVGADGSAYLGGQTGSDETQFPGGNGFGGLQGADTTYNGAQDAFVAKVNPTGIGFAWASFIGGSAGDQGFGLAADGMGSLYVVGTTFSDEATFPNGNGSGPQLGPDLSFNGNQDVFVVRIQETLQAPAIDVPLSGTSSVLLALSLLALGIGFISHASGRS